MLLSFSFFLFPFSFQNCSRFCFDFVAAGRAAVVVPFRSLPPPGDIYLFIYVQGNDDGDDNNDDGNNKSSLVVYFLSFT